MSEGSPSRRHPAVLVASVVLPVVLLVVVIVAAVVAQRVPDREPVAVASVPAPAATSAECESLRSALPGDFGRYTSAEIASPAPPATYAWEPSDGGEPVILRCGLDQPLEFVKGSSIEQVNGVQWFTVSAAVSTTYFAVDRGVYLALTVPRDEGPTPLQTMSDVIAAAIPFKEPAPLPLPN